MSSNQLRNLYLRKGDMNYKVLCVFLLLLSLFLSLAFWNKKKSLGAYESVRIENAELIKTRDSLGREIANFEVIVLNQEALSASKDSLIDSLRKASDNWKSMYLYVKADLETKGEIEASVRDSVVVKDSVMYKAGVFDWSDRWLTMKGVHILDMGKISIDYSIRNSMAISYEWQRAGLFARPVLKGTIVNENPNTTVGRVTTFTVSAPERRVYEKWWFQLGAGFVLGGVSGYLIGR